MKIKTLIVCIVFALSATVFAQQNYRNSGSFLSENDQNNELRINLLMAIVGLPEVNYERFLGENMGVGLAAAVSIEKVADMSLRSMVLPYYRIYFGERKASGFFIEGNMALAKQKEYLDMYYYDTSGVPYSRITRTSTNFGFGAAVGFKLLTRSGVTGELYLGAGRLFGNYIDGAYPRVGICIGKRF